MLTNYCMLVLRKAASASAKGFLAMESTMWMGFWNRPGLARYNYTVSSVFHKPVHITISGFRDPLSMGVSPFHMLWLYVLWYRVSVRDLVGRVCNVVLIKCILDLGKPKRGWSLGREGTGARWGTRGVSLQATWDWGGWFLSQLGGFQVSRKGSWQGEMEARGMCHV